jgi:type VI secretion system protein ImpH
MMQWLPLGSDNLTRVGAANSRIGIDLVCGAKIPISQSKFRLRFGPLTYRQFLDFLPKGTAYPAVIELARLLAGLELDFDIQPVLKASEVPSCQLSSDEMRLPMLGWTTWLSTGSAKKDAEEVILEVN